MILMDYIKANWQGTPYLWKSANRNNGGIDPLFFLLDVIDVYYGKQLKVNNFTDLFHLTQEAPLAEEGMLVFFKKTGFNIHHGGIMVNDEEMAHISPSKGMIFTNIITSQYWGPMKYKFGVL